jgi:hypothetical protein
VRYNWDLIAHTGDRLLADLGRSARPVGEGVEARPADTTH